MNIIDLVAGTLLILFLYLGYRAGLWSFGARLVSLVSGLAAALFGYALLGAYLAPYVGSERVGAAIAFIVLLVGVEFLVGALERRVFRAYPGFFKENAGTRVFALIPAGIEAAVIVLLLIVASPVLPLPTSISQKISASYVGTIAAREVPAVQDALDRATGGRLSAALSEFMTREGSSEGMITLPYRPLSTSIDEPAEVQMLALVNEERAKVGAPMLVIDPTLTTSARLHSEDMWSRQYFAHVNPDGLEPGQRMTRAGARYLIAGENLALAPSTQMAHTGLMNSPGHKRNILDPRFRRVGIGIIDGGVFGKMVTQNFAD